MPVRCCAAPPTPLVHQGAFIHDASISSMPHSHSEILMRLFGWNDHLMGVSHILTGYIRQIHGDVLLDAWLGAQNPPHPLNGMYCLHHISCPLARTGESTCSESGGHEYLPQRDTVLAGVGAPTSVCLLNILCESSIRCWAH